MEAEFRQNELVESLCAHGAERGREAERDHELVQETASNHEEEESLDEPRCHFFRHKAFFLGTLFATSGSLWDLCEAVRSSGADDDDDDGQDVSPLRFWNFYKVMSVASTLMYLLDSVADGCDDYRDQSRAFSLVFGLAAIFDLTSCIIDDDYEPWPAYYVGAVAVCLFLLSGLLVLYINRLKYSCTSVSMAAILLGDLFFVAGSTVDVCVSYWDNPEKPAEWIWVSA